MSEDNNYDAGKSTEWNQAIAYLQRLDLVLRFCASSSNSNNYQAWFKGINNLYNELYAWMEEEEVKFADSLVDPLHNVLNNDSWNDSVKYKKFLKAERYLRTIMHKKGMDLPKKKKIADLWNDMSGDI